MIYIYTLSHPLTKEVRYVGKTKSPKRRYNDHIYRLDAKDRKTCWIKSLLNEGLKPIMGIIEECEGDWSEREKYWIKQFNNLTNLTEGGEGSANYKHSADVKEKLRLLNSGSKNPNFGKKTSEETKEKIRIANKGKTKNVEHIKKISKSCIVNDIKYISVSEASRTLKIPYVTLLDRLNSKNFENYIWWNENNPLSLHRH